MESQKNVLITTVLNSIGSLVNDEFGNYIIQFILDLKEKQYNELIYTYILKNLLPLSKKKFSSNVIDKYIIQDDDLSIKLINHMIENKLIGEMISDQYGNYVIQKAIDTARNENTQKYLLQMIFPIVNEIRKDNFGRQLFSKLYNKYRQFQEIVTNMNSK